MKPYLLFIISLILIPTTFADFRINEIMYNPIGSDSNKEFIEIFHEPWIKLTGFNISDGKKNETLVSIQLNPYSKYSLIIEDDSILPHPNCSIYTTDSTIANGGLNNDETIYLFNHTQLIDKIIINSSIANNNGFSIEYYNGSYHQSYKINGTPGYQNSFDGSIILTDSTSEFNLKSPLFIHKLYRNLFKIKIDKNNCSIKTNITYIYNITGINFTYLNKSKKEIGCSSYSKTGNLYIQHPGNYTICITINTTLCQTFTFIDPKTIPCNVSLSLHSTKQIYNEKIEYYNSLDNDTFEYEIEYWVEDVHGNILMKKKTSTNQNKKTYTPKTDETDKVIVLKNNLKEIYCNNSSNQTANTLVVGYIGEIKNTQIELDAPAEVTKNFNIELDIYKGDTSRYSVKAQIKGITEITRINLLTKNRQYKFSVPLYFKNLCEVKNNTYQLIVEGLGEEMSQDIIVTGKHCPKETITIQINNTITKNNTIKIQNNITRVVTKLIKQNQTIKNITNISRTLFPITGNIIYKSPSLKAYEKAPYLLIIALLLLFFRVLYKRPSKKI